MLGPGEDDDLASVRLVTGFRLRKVHGGGRWRKLKGSAFVGLPDGTGVLAELHWCETHGVGRKDMKTKRLLE